MSNFYQGERVSTPDGKGVIFEVSDLWYIVKLEKDGTINYYMEHQLERH